MTHLHPESSIGLHHDGRGELVIAHYHVDAASLLPRLDELGVGPAHRFMIGVITLLEQAARLIELKQMWLAGPFLNRAGRRGSISLVLRLPKTKCVTDYIAEYRARSADQVKRRIMEMVLRRYVPSSQDEACKVIAMLLMLEEERATKFWCAVNCHVHLYSTAAWEDINIDKRLELIAYPKCPADPRRLTPQAVIQVNYSPGTNAQT